jgi:hypothetical protein
MRLEVGLLICFTITIPEVHLLLKPVELLFLILHLHLHLY